MIYGEPKWIIDSGYGTISHFKGGMREMGALPKESDYDVIIPLHYVPELVQFLTDKAYIKPQMSTESREEDLKIVHRLIDILQSKPLT